ncbi:hypothetical protein A2U01_0050858, partial [Trifolium medium]|nr:hypothetical protein [Trifolium medium]
GLRIVDPQLLGEIWEEQDEEQKGSNERERNESSSTLASFMIQNETKHKVKEFCVVRKGE